MAEAEQALTQGLSLTRWTQSMKPIEAIGLAKCAIQGDRTGKKV
jgi:hypothetical protein